MAEDEVLSRVLVDLCLVAHAGVPSGEAWLPREGVRVVVLGKLRCKDRPKL